MSVSNFDFKIVKKFAGYNSSSDKTNLNPAFLIRGSKNVYKKQSGTIAIREGQKRRGTADSTNAGVISSYVWEASNGVTKPLRVANSKLEVESDIVTSGTYVWYAIQSSLASTVTRYVFDTVWDDTLKKDFLVFVRGDANLFRWDGGIGKIVSTTVNTIVLNATVASLGFNTTSGSVVVNGTTYTYSGSSASTLTGVAADPTGEAVNSVVISAVITNADKPAASVENDFLKVINNQVHIGSYSSQLIYISEDDDYLDYTVPATPVPGDPELITLDSLGRGIGVIDGEAYASAGFSDWFRIHFNQITVGSTLTRQTIVDKLALSGLEAALGHEYISNLGGYIVYLSRNKEVKLLGVFTNQQQTKPATLSLPIKDELKGVTFSPLQGETSDGELVSVGDRLYVTSATDGKTYIHETREALTEDGQLIAERFWQPPFIWSISRIAVIAGVEYGHSIANPQVYELWDTGQWHDDSPSDEPLPYDAIMRMAYQQHGLRQGILDVNMAYYEGYMAQGTTLHGKVYFDYQGSSSLQDFEISKVSLPQRLAKFFSGFLNLGLGESSLGDNPLGDGLTDEELSQEQLPKFRRIKDLNKTDCFEYSLEVYSDEVDSRWEILALGTSAMKSGRQATFLR